MLVLTEYCYHHHWASVKCAAGLGIDTGQRHDVKICFEDCRCLDIRSLEAGDINVVQTVILFISLQGGALPQSDHTNIK